MNNFRRRTGSNISYVFSAQSTSVSVSYNSSSKNIGITSTANGSNIGYSVVSYNGCVTAVTTAATSITLSFSTNTTTSSKSGEVILKQSGSNNTLRINVTQQGQQYHFSLKNGDDIMVLYADGGTHTRGVWSYLGTSSNTIPFSITSYDGIIITGATTNGIDSITVNYSANPSGSIRRTTLTLKQSGSNRILSVEIIQY